VEIQVYKKNLSQRRDIQDGVQHGCHFSGFYFK